eukprot:CAMPEP_0201701016 /NCGR_PEP_ID=MMETSP0578-20130828/30933_1 /ASSEMBLY_ACC=CAM_ASM_000663 /TAXON_ID=267565 /ORGANISM="Skeletonema grethea, Strain CCMP 1804" /LENGTH=77 /DNA_ID=CAMNT_0048188229 /DNA_START=41 /DNA_END=271 /DNA_ORIENTATION=+
MIVHIFQSILDDFFFLFRKILGGIGGILPVALFKGAHAFLNSTDSFNKHGNIVLQFFRSVVTFLRDIMSKLIACLDQ